jgi:bifunctional DNase/RNase
MELQVITPGGILPLMPRACAVLLLIFALGCSRRFLRGGHAADAGPPPVVAAAPIGYIEGHVLQRPSPAGGSMMVLVSDPSETLALPIFIGGTEATTIDLRLKGDKYARPLTHDILSETIHEMGGRAVQVQVDELIADTYHGTIVLERPDGSFATLDARPSDCIALSLGEKIPVYLRKRLLEDEGIPVPAVGSPSARGHGGASL